MSPSSRLAPSPGSDSRGESDDPRGPRGDRGFVLLEVLVALVLFATIVLSYAAAADKALEASAEANATRRLRLMAAEKLAEIRARPAEFRDGGEGGFETEADSEGDDWRRDYRFSVEPKEVIVAGYSSESGVEYLNPADETDGPPKLPEGKKTPDPVSLVQLTITITHVPEGESETERMKVVTFVPVEKQPGAK